jgi:hypothetical protein
MRISFGVWQANDNAWAGPSTVDFNTQTNLEVVIDYIKVWGEECGGGRSGEAPSVMSPGFTSDRLYSLSNWTPETSSVLGSGYGLGNAFGSRSGNDKSNSGGTLTIVSAACMILAVLVFIF